ncbi:MAG: hypothetical protein ABMB14_31640, partial [Myxococcota bacterium]
MARCDAVRAALRERSLAELDRDDGIAAHLADCADCAAALARIREAEAAIAASLDAFAAAGDLDAALHRALT